VSDSDWLKEATAGSTPLDPDEAVGLIPSHIYRTAQLDQWEHENILTAEIWAFAHKRRAVLSDSFVRRLHKQMFDRTWRWAGMYRKSEKNIGVAPYSIATGVADTVGDAAHWIEKKIFQMDEIAVRVHHRLVSVHPFSNGNGRHARLFANILLYQHDVPPLSWGRLMFKDVNDARLAYLDALRAADRQDYHMLLKFARG
jgi:Fic-DOC domain mobile mystery protein B